MRESMTDTFYPPPAITSHDLAPPALSKPRSYPEHHRNGASPMESAQEDDGQISCFCGFADDDGNTVACDLCNRWQHTTCYYPQYDGRELPDELQHFCVDCRPASFDVDEARNRQKVKRQQPYPMTNGNKRPVNKSHKKKTKEPPAAGYTNGWPLDKARHDRNSASPRDQPPPAKRPKTTHRSSESISKAHSRKRNASTANPRSLSQSPDQPTDYYTPEFLRSYADDEWVSAEANLYNDISVTNALSEWLHTTDELFLKRTGQRKGELLMRWDSDLDTIPGKAQLDILDSRDLNDNPEMPNYKLLTVNESVAPGAYIGELKGHVGFVHQYKDDPANRWPTLRHPEPFVFFHQTLGIYIDARNEGTELRYVRRSCRPNARLQVLVTDQTNCHFCFMATEQIDPGMEIAVGWDTQDSVPTRRNDSMSPTEVDALAAWATNVLGNCGPCACNMNNECAMAHMVRLDRRAYEESPPPIKAPKSRKKKAGHNISPLNTNALNSRSGSEARRGDADDEPTDSRSVSGSGGGSASRDITPNTHYSANGSLATMPESSERERKKLAKEEELFRRQEGLKITGKAGKKKRSSAGSNLNTPGATSAKQPKYTDASTSRQSGLPSKTVGRRPKGPSSLKNSTNRVVKVVPRPKPVYTDADTQCDMDQEEAEQRAAQRAAAPQSAYLSTTQRLLARCAINNSRRKASSPMTPPKSIKAAEDENAMDLDATTSPAPSLPDVKTDPAISDASAAPLPDLPEATADTADTHMQDVEDVREPSDPHDESADLPKADIEPSSSSPAPSHPSSDPAAPPWPSKLSPSSETAESADPMSMAGQKPPSLHVSMPPPPAAGTNWLTSAAAHSSPISLMGPSAPLFSPSVTAAVQPSPARKKLSLSDYTKRSKAKPAPERDGSPASTASGPVVPPLQASASENQREGSQAVEDDRDVKMEDVGDAPTPTAAADSTASTSNPAVPATTDTE